MASATGPTSRDMLRQLAFPVRVMPFPTRSQMPCTWIRWSRSPSATTCHRPKRRCTQGPYKMKLRTLLLHTLGLTFHNCCPWPVRDHYPKARQLRMLIGFHLVLVEDWFLRLVTFSLLVLCRTANRIKPKVMRLSADMANIAPGNTDHLSPSIAITFRHHPSRQRQLPPPRPRGTQRLEAHKGPFENEDSLAAVPLHRTLKHMICGQAKPFRMLLGFHVSLAHDI